MEADRIEYRGFEIALYEHNRAWEAGIKSLDPDKPAPFPLGTPATRSPRPDETLSKAKQLIDRLLIGL